MTETILLLLGPAGLLVGLWWGDRRGARRVSAYARTEIDRVENERDSFERQVRALANQLRQAWQREDYRIERIAKARDRIAQLRALTLDGAGNDLPADTPLTVGQVQTVLDGDTAPPQATDKEHDRA